MTRARAEAVTIMSGDHDTLEGVMTDHANYTHYKLN